MKLGRVVDWDDDVLPSWRKHAPDSRDANADIWQRLPDGVCWVCGDIEPPDLAQLYVVGSADWFEEFGSYRVNEIATRLRAAPHGGVDPGCDFGAPSANRHRDRIGELRASLRKSSHAVPPLVLVCADVRGPFVIVDGNHRALALLQLDLLSGQPCYLGLHRNMGKFLWMQRALAGA